jgi:hypothetical protein
MRVPEQHTALAHTCGAGSYLCKALQDGGSPPRGTSAGTRAGLFQMTGVKVRGLC